jgi:HlyD family secretion protein
VDQLPFERGERVPAGAVLAVVLSDEAPWVRVWIPETAVARVHAGTRARVRVDGVAGPLRGRVLDVAREPEFTPHYALTERDRVHLVYETRVLVEDGPAELRPGVPAEVELFPEDAAAPEAAP